VRLMSGVLGSVASLGAWVGATQVS
jgi:hypothetical protein